MRCTWQPAGVGNTTLSAFLQLLINSQKNSLQTKAWHGDSLLRKAFPLEVRGESVSRAVPTP